MSKLFGTDGVRGVANETITVELATELAQAAAVVLGHEDAEGARPKAVIARDPRISSEFITAAVSAGLASSGVDVYDAGVLPTPAAAFLVDDINADFGVMISASHNPAPDNGIKFLARGGEKLTDARYWLPPRRVKQSGSAKIASSSRPSAERRFTRSRRFSLQGSSSTRAAAVPA